jgi:hypothetical protein
MEMFAASRLAGADRLTLMREVPRIFRARWLPWIRQEAEILATDLPTLLSRISVSDTVQAGWMVRSLAEALHGVAAIVPEVDLTLARFELATLAGELTVQNVAP